MILQEPFAISSAARTFTRSLTVDHTQVPSTQSDFPVLVSVTDNTLKTVANGGHVHGSNQFTFSSDSAGASLLKWEVERYNASTGEIVAWVKISSLSSSSDTVFYLRYGASITTDQSDPANVWTNSFLSVYHLKDGSSLSVADSLGSFNGSNQGATAGSGKIDGAAAFASASNQYIITGDQRTAAMSMSCWINATSFPNAYNSTWTTGLSNFNQNFRLLIKSSGKLACTVFATSQLSYDGTGSNTLSTATWYHVALTYDSSAGLVGYVNGGSDGTVSANGAIKTTSAVTAYIGKDLTTTPDYPWNGTIDEVKVASVARSANWITTEYNNTNNPGSFITLGSES